MMGKHGQFRRAMLSGDSCCSVCTFICALVKYEHTGRMVGESQRKKNFSALFSVRMK